MASWKEKNQKTIDADEQKTKDALEKRVKFETHPFKESFDFPSGYKRFVKDNDEVKHLYTANYMTIKNNKETKDKFYIIYRLSQWKCFEFDNLKDAVTFHKMIVDKKIKK